MRQELRHYWHSNMANAPKDGERMSQGARPWASAVSPVEGEWENFGSAGRWLSKIRVTLGGLSRSQAVGLGKSRCLSSPCWILLLPRPLLFILEGRGISAYSTLPTSRLFTTSLALMRQKPTNKASSLCESRLERALELAILPLQRFLNLPL